MLIPFKSILAKYNIKPSGVLHIGANNGAEAKDYYDNGIRKAIFIEAIPSIYAELTEHLKKYPDYIAINACVSDVDGQQMPFNISSNHGESSSLFEFGTHKTAHPEVNVVEQIILKTSRVDTLLEENNLNIEEYDFLNIDLEGAELLALKSMSGYLKKIKYAYIEVRHNELYVGSPLVKDIDTYMEEYGFVGVAMKMTDFGWGDKLYFKNKLSKVKTQLFNFDGKMQTYSGFINLDHRTDRLGRMKSELARVGLSAHRHSGLLPNEYIGEEKKVAAMRERTPGAIGCHFSQVMIMQTAFNLGRNAFVMEDDLVFCSDFKERALYIEKFLNTHQWDVFWLGGTYHRDPMWHKKDHPILPECHCKLNADFELTDDSRIVRTYGIWSTYAYIVNYHSIKKILKLLDENLHQSIGIDWLFILLQPQLHTYAFVPGCVKQMDGISDIGSVDKKRETTFSGFASLGTHWFADRIGMEKKEPDEMEQVVELPNFEEISPAEYKWPENSELDKIASEIQSVIQNSSRKPQAEELQVMFQRWHPTKTILIAGGKATITDNKSNQSITINI